MRSTCSTQKPTSPSLLSHHSGVDSCLTRTPPRDGKRAHGVRSLVVPFFASLCVASAIQSALAAPPADATRTAHAAPAAGVYHAVSPVKSRLTVSEVRRDKAGKNVIIVDWTGSGDDRAGTAVSATCEARLELRESATPRKWDATLVPFESDIGGLTEKDIATMPTSALQLTARDKNIIIASGVMQHCGMNVAFAGKYRRHMLKRN